MIKSVPAAGIVRSCTIETPIASIVREHKAVQAAVCAHINTATFHRLLLVACHSVERVTQIPTVKRLFDLDGFTEVVDKDQNVHMCLQEVLAVHPELTSLLSPEIKLMLALSSGAVLCASANAEKKAAQLVPPRLLEGQNRRVLH
jgi:F0F1-type ATP synthase gamma subunit